LKVIGLAGKIPLKPTENFYRYFDVLLPISNQTDDPAVAMQNTSQNLRRTAKQIGNMLALK
jgi:glycerate kinase